jgi:ribosomal protein S15
LVQTANLSQREKVKLMKKDPYRWAQAEQRKAANVKRKEELEVTRGQEWGSPVHGLTTPFVESFDSGGQALMSTPAVDEDGNPLEKAHDLPTSPHIRNYLLSREEVDKALEHCYSLTKPPSANQNSTLDPVKEAEDLAKHEERHAKAIIALQRIADLDNGSARDRKHANIRRCVDTFGRHNTDQTLERPLPPPVPGHEKAEKIRGGPDTGSSEVQIAILTSKIRALASKLEGPKGNRDKNNKRSLANLCHRRQALLRYMERKERGSGRWHHMIKTLGLSPATWKDQITL